MSWEHLKIGEVRAGLEAFLQCARVRVHTHACAYTHMHTHTRVHTHAHTRERAHTCTLAVHNMEQVQAAAGVGGVAQLKGSSVPTAAGGGDQLAGEEPRPLPPAPLSPDNGGNKTTDVPLEVKMTNAGRDLAGLRPGLMGPGTHRVQDLRRRFLMRERR